MNFPSSERHICWCAHTSFNLYTLQFFSSGPWSVYSEFIWDTFGLSNRTDLTSIPLVHHEGKGKGILQSPLGTGDMRGWLQRPSVISYYRNICVTSNIVQGLDVLFNHTYLWQNLSGCPTVKPTGTTPPPIFVWFYTLGRKSLCTVYS